MTTTQQTTVGDGVDGASSDAVAHGGVRMLTVNRVVAAALALGAGALALAFMLDEPGVAAFELYWLSGPLLLVALGVLTVAAELFVVPMRHDDDAVEGLTLLDGVILLNTLLLPVRDAVLVSLCGILAAHLLARRGWLKTLYNLGVYASASTAAAVLLQGIGSPAGEFDVRLLFAMTAATASFVIINLVYMAVLLSVLSDTTPWNVVRQDAGLSAMTVVGTVCLTVTVLVLSVTAPVLLPCAALPAAALRYAYGASAAKVEERRRSARVLEYSQVLASGPTRARALEAYLTLVSEEFEGSSPMVVFHDGTGVRKAGGSSPVEAFVTTSDHESLLSVEQLSVLSSAGLPFGWQSAMVAPMVVEGHRLGAVALGSPTRAQFHLRDRTMLSSLVGALGVALQNAHAVNQLVEEASKLRAVVDQASDGIAVLGRHGVIQVWSPAMTLITGVSHEAAVGRTLGEVLGVEDLEQPPFDPFVADCDWLTPLRPQASVDVQLRREDGESRCARFAHAGMFESGSLVRDVLLVRDLTAERQVQRMKSDFIATVSHELRTPLTPLKGYAGMLRKHADTMPPEKRARALDMIVERTEHLGRLVEDLLSASSMTAEDQPRHALTLERADLTALVRRAQEDFATARTRMELEAQTDELTVLCDPVRVVQIGSNLISNALKYSGHEKRVTIRVNRVGNLARMEVEDAGCGIPADQMERIFDKFHRVEDPMVMSTGGTGLGLFIARHLARAMNGEIVAESSLGAGSRFTFTLPVAPEPALEEPAR